MSTFKSLKQAECLDKLVLNFYKSELNFILTPEDVQFLTWDMQHNFLDLTINSERLKKYPGSREFTRLFFKKLIDCLQDVQDIHDGFFTALCASVLRSKDNEANIFFFRHYVIGNDLDNIITLRETRNMVVNGTTGLRTWEAARMLADWAMCNKKKFMNKQVLELGSGVGFTGITIAKMCNTQTMYLTDCHPDVLETLAKNIEINFPESEYDKSNSGEIFRNGQLEIGVKHLNWNDYNEFPDSIVPDVIIGADIVYDPSIMDPLCKVFKHFFSKNHKLKIYIQSVVRNQKTFEKFYHMLGYMNFGVERISQKQSTFIDWDPKTGKSLLKIISSNLI